MFKRIGQNFAAQAVGLAVSFADRLLVVGILLRVWGPATYADWALLLSAAGVLSLGELGLNVYFGNQFQKANSENNAAMFRRMVSVAFGCSLVTGAVVGLGGLVALLFADIPTLISISVLSRVQGIAILCMLSFVSLSRLVRGVISQIYRGRQEFARGTMIDQVYLSTLVVLTIVSVYFGATPLLVAAIYFVSDLIAGWGLILTDLSRRWPEHTFVPKLPTRAELVDTWRHVRWLAILNGTSNGWVQLPVVLLGILGITGKALVSFLVLRTLSNLARQIATQFAIASGVEITSTYFSGRHAEAARQLEAAGIVLSVTVAALSVGVVLYGSAFVSLWTGHAGLFDLRIVGPLFAAIVVCAPALPLLIFGMYGNSFAPLATASIVQLVIGLPVCGVLAVRYGAVGAAVGLAVGDAVAQGMVIPFLTSRNAGVRYWRYLAKCAAAMSGAALWCGGIGLTLRLVLDDRTVWGLLLSGAFWGVVGVLPVLGALLPAEQRNAALRLIWPRIGGAAVL